MNVLTIDDEQDIGFILNLQLKLSGHETTFFETIPQAQRYLSENLDQVDAIICDFKMPLMNGLEFFLWARSINYTKPFYVLTGEPSMDTESLLKSGITQVLFKPQDLNKLSEILNS